MRRKVINLVLTVASVVFPAAGVCADAPPKAAAGRIALDMVTSFPKGTITAADSEHWANEINRRAKGELVLNWKGGPEAIPTFDQPEALRKGVFQVHHGVANYFAGVVPGAEISDLSPFAQGQIKKSSELYLYMVKMWEEKGFRFLGEHLGPLNPASHFFFTNKRVNKLEDLAGQKIRVSPTTMSLVQALRAEAITLPGAETYTATQRGVIDGLTWPIAIGAVQMGWHEVTKNVIEPGLYRGVWVMVVNLDTWKKLPKHVQDLMIDVTFDTSAWYVDYITKQDASQRATMKKAGVQFLQLPAADAKRLSQMSKDVAWQNFKKILPPDRYTKLRQLLKYE